MTLLHVASVLNSTVETIDPNSYRAVATGPRGPHMKHSLENCE